MTLRLRRLGLALALTALIAHSAPAGAATGIAGGHSSKPLTLAVIGDVPYGVAQEATFPTLIDAINRDPKVRLAVHVGDIKSGSTTCTDERFAAVAAAFDTFKDPLIYTPGDNEWTDCHRPNNGGYNPLERLRAIRSLFFSEPGDALGRHPMTVDYQPDFPENVMWIESQVVFASAHVVGSNNGLNPWTGIGFIAPTAEQTAEVDSRLAATLEWIDAAFDLAEAHRLEGVVLAMQADTWDPAPTTAQQAIVDRIADRTAGFDGQVLVLQGDSHTFKADDPLALGNFTRIVVHGETTPFEYLRLTIDSRDEDLFSWERVPV